MRPRCPSKGRMSDDELPTLEKALTCPALLKARATAPPAPRATVPRKTQVVKGNVGLDASFFAVPSSSEADELIRRLQGGGASVRGRAKATLFPEGSLSGEPVEPAPEPIEVESESDSEDSSEDEAPTPRGRKKAVAFHAGTPSFLRTSTPDADIPARLGISTLTHHPVPHVFHDAIDGTRMTLPTLESAAAAREDGWAHLQEFIIVSMDPAVTNFAIRAERRSRDGRSSRTVFFDVLNCDPGSRERMHDESVPKSRRRGMGKADEQGELKTYARLHLALYSQPLRSTLESAHVVLIEHQHEFQNPKATRMSGHALGLIAGLLSTQRDFTAPMLIEVSSKLKNAAVEIEHETALLLDPGIRLPLGRRIRASDLTVHLAPLLRAKKKDVRELTRARLKTGAVKTAERLLPIWRDATGLTYLAKPVRGSGETTTKRDDLADCVMMVAAWMRAVGWGPVGPLTT